MNDEYYGNTVEWSHIILAETVDEKEKRIDLSAPKDAFNLLCHRLNLEEIHHIKCTLNIRRDPVTKIIQLSGALDAHVDQICVVTGEPVDEKITDDFQSWYIEPNETVSFTKAKRERMSEKEREEQPMLEEFEDPETVVDGKIDVGEVVIQFLSLSLNPYPKRPGARGNFGDPLEEAPDGTYDNPFAALKEWKAQEKSETKK